MQIKKSTELVVVGGMLAISLASTYANAGPTTVASGVATAATIQVNSGDAGQYVLEAFKLNVSANVIMSVDGDTQAVGVRSGSKKGMHTFGGSSNGGSVKQCEAASLDVATLSTNAAAAGKASGCS